MLQREPTYFKEGLHTLKRAYVFQRGPAYFKEGLRTSTGASVLQKAHIHPRAVRPTYFIEAVINTQRTNTLNFEFFDAVFWKSTN